MHLDLKYKLRPLPRWLLTAGTPGVPMEVPSRAWRWKNPNELICEAFLRGTRQEGAKELNHEVLIYPPPRTYHPILDQIQVPSQGDSVVIYPGLTIMKNICVGHLILSLRYRAAIVGLKEAAVCS